MKIINLGHACYLIKGQNVSVVIDPYRNRSVPNLTLPHVEANYVLCTHDHYDHNAKELINIIPTNNELIYETIVVPHDHHNGEHRGLNNMYLLNIDGYRVLHTGDLGCIPHKDVLEKMQNVDIMLAPINGYYTISAKELKDIIDIVHPKVIIPIHYHKKENNSGYPDGEQIDAFKDLVKNYLEIDGYEAEVNDKFFDNKAVIFKKELQE
ncbi:MAG: MBL fold metallo-hydrolase [Bacilli bacterium]|nr:MBL fold metallo-hydrolase [Bacilli bacterium]